MKSLIAFGVLAAACGSALAQWVAVGESSLGKVYVNQSTISKSGDLVKLWELIDLKKAQEYRGESFVSYTSEVEYDCVRKSFHTLQTVGLSGRMATGSVVASGSGSRQWQPVSGGTPADHGWRFACGKK